MHRFNPSQNDSPILLLIGLVMVTNKESIACLQMLQIRKDRGYLL